MYEDPQLYSIILLNYLDNDYMVNAKVIKLWIDMLS